MQSVDAAHEATTGSTAPSRQRMSYETPITVPCAVYAMLSYTPGAGRVSLDSAFERAFTKHDQMASSAVLRQAGSQAADQRQVSQVEALEQLQAPVLHLGVPVVPQIQEDGQLGGSRPPAL